MTTDHGERDDKRNLRQRAALRMAESGRRAEHDAGLSQEDAAKLICELSTHQIELELQNEDLRAAQLALSEAHERYRELYDFAPVGYLTLDQDTRVLEANLRAAELLGSPRANLNQRRFVTFVAEVDQDALFLCLRTLRATKQRCELDLRLRRPNADACWARCEWTVVEKGPRAGDLRVTLSDITERKRLEAQLALADRLSSVGLLAASIGHEVNNPLTYMLYHLETVTADLPALARTVAGWRETNALPGEGGRSPLGEITEACVELDDIAERVRWALEGASRIRNLVQGLRAFSRADEELTEPVSLNAVIETALTMTAREISARAKLSTALGDLPKVSANHGQMCQLLVNLLLNAAHAIEEGNADGNAISVRSWSESDRVLVEVADTGCGIAPENIEKIFDPFFTTKPAGKGTGLGLSICAKIVHDLGGRLSVKSAVNEGTTFTLCLPATAERQKATAGSEAAPPKEPLRGRILVVDDEPCVREAMAHILARHDVVLANSGREGVEVLSRDPEFDVVLCDLMMPDVSGMDLLGWLEEHHAPLVGRVVFVTGGAFTPRTQEFLAQSNLPRLQKPFEADALRTAVDDVLVKARAERP